MNRPKSNFWSALKVVGPGLAIAATGVGAGDLLAAMLAGAEFGTALLWVIVIGAALKLGLNEGVARWQLATGTTLLEGWCRYLGWPIKAYFLIYLVLWSFIVAGGLMSACGVAAHALWPVMSIRSWAILQSLVALVLVWFGRYVVFEQIMKILIGLMTLTLLASVAIVGVDLAALLRGLVPSLPSGSAAAALSLMGGVGGSVTLLAYGYWIREKGWRGEAAVPRVRIDLAVGYGLTGLFGVAMLLLASSVLGGGGGLPPGSQGLVACGDAIRDAAADGLGASAAQIVSTIFLVGVWGAVFTSTLGVWNGVPYLFSDYLDALRGRYESDVETRGVAYRGYLLYLAFPPMLLLFLDRPMWVIKVYTLTGGLFMPVLAATLLWLNSRRTLVGSMRNGWAATATLVLALVLFALIAVRQVADFL